MMSGQIKHLMLFKGLIIIGVGDTLRIFSVLVEQSNSHSNFIATRGLIYHQSLLLLLLLFGYRIQQWLYNLRPSLALVHALFMC